MTTQPFFILVNVLQKLIKNPDKMSREHLVIDWRILYSALVGLVFPSSKDHLFPEMGHSINDLSKLIRTSSRFFSDSAAYEIVEEMLPYLNAHHAEDFTVRCGVFVMFLPTYNIPVHPLTGNVGFFYKELCFKIWDSVINNLGHSNMFLELFGQIAKDQFQHPEHTLWTSTEISTIFSNGVKSLRLPVGTTDGLVPHQSVQSGHNSSVHVIDGSHLNHIEMFASFAIYSLFPPALDDRKYGSTVFEHIMTLTYTIEPYFHPSNSGAWTEQIAELVLSLAEALFKRQSLEQKLNMELRHQVPLDMKEKMIHRISNLVYLGMFSKNIQVSRMSHSALQYLCWTAPQIVFPNFLNQFYESLDSLTATQRTLSSISAMAFCAVPLTEYPQGNEHIMSILNITLPGIDINDPFKSMATFSLYSVLFSLPCTNFNITQNSVNHIHHCDFEDWLVRFLDRIFVLFDNLPQNYGIQTRSWQNLENSVISMLKMATEVIFAQLDVELERLAISILLRLVQTRQNVRASKIIGDICSHLCPYRPIVRLKAFVPLCVSKILAELENGASSAVSGNESLNHFGMSLPSDAQLHWYQSILLRCVSYSGSDLLEFKEIIMDVIAQTIERCNSPRGYKWAAKLFRRTVHSLLTVYPMEFSSFRLGKVFPDDWSGLTLIWHTPSSNEIAFASELINIYLQRSFRETDAMMKSGESSEINKCLVLLYNSIHAMGPLIMPKAGYAHENESEVLRDYSPRYYNFHLAPTIELPGWEVLNDSVGKLLVNLSLFIQKHLSDSIHPAQLLLKCIWAHFTLPGIHTYVETDKKFKFFKSLMKYTDQHEVYTQPAVIAGVHYLHCERLNHAVEGACINQKNSRLYQQILKFSFSKYKALRAEAQAVLDDCIGYGLPYRLVLYPYLIESLKSENCQEIKGALYILKSGYFKGLYYFHMMYFQQLVSSLANIQSEDLSLLRLVRNIEKEMTREYCGITIVFPKVDIKPPIDCAISGKLRKEMEAIALARNITEVNHYELLIQIIADMVSNPNTPWRTSSFLVEICVCVISNTHVFPESLVKIAVDGSLHEISSMRSACRRLLNRLLITMKVGSRIYNPKLFNDGSVSIESSCFVDSHSFNWLTSPKLIPYYQGQASIQLNSSFQSCFDYFSKSMHSETYWRLLLALNSESAKNFNYGTAKQLARIFSLVQPLDALMPVLQEYVDNIAEANQQRAAAEVVAGLLRGSKHWDRSKPHQFDVISRILRQALEGCSPEGLMCWMDCIIFAGVCLI